jgi:membrane protein implicated in regulation of membrane protease activity
LLGLLPFAAMVGGVVGLLSGNDVWSQSLLAILIGGVLAVLIVAYLLRPLRPDAGDPQQQEEQVASTPPASVIWWQRVAGWLKSS